jgi:hypothetical protein
VIHRALMGRRSFGQGQIQPLSLEALWLANGVAVQALEIAGQGGGLERLDGSSTNGAGVGAVHSGLGATLAAHRQCLGRRHPPLGQSLRGGAQVRRADRRSPGASNRLGGSHRRTLPNGCENLPAQQTHKGRDRLILVKFWQNELDPSKGSKRPLRVPLCTFHAPASPPVAGAEGKRKERGPEKHFGRRLPTEDGGELLPRSPDGWKQKRSRTKLAAGDDPDQSQFSGGVLEGSAAEEAGEDALKPRCEESRAIIRLFCSHGKGMVT